MLEPLILLLALGLLAQANAWGADDAGDGEAAPVPTIDPSASTATQPSDGTGDTPPMTLAKAVGLPSGANVAVIPIEGMIYGFTHESLERRTQRALDQGASVIVIELDTNGGAVSSALEMSKQIKSINVPTIAWINDKAYSAGIMIASACDHIVMSPASSTGDCAPIVPGQNLEPTERAKALSPILEEFRDNATKNNYDYALFHAMCVLGAKVYLLKHEETGDRRLVNQVDYRVMVKGVAPDADDGGARGGISRLLGLGGADAADDDVGKVSLTVATDEDRGRWKPVEMLPSGTKLPNGLVHDGSTLLTLNQTRAEDIELSKATIRNETNLSQYLGTNTIFYVKQSWSEDMAGYLTHPMVRLVLIIALLLGAYVEFQTPGLGFAGAVAAIALVLLLGAPFLVGLAEVWHVLLFLLGFLVLIIELAFTPSFGLLGVLGLAMMFTGLVLSIVPTSGGSGVGPIRLPPRELWGRLLASTVYLLLGVMVSFVGFYFITKHFGRIPLLNRLVLSNDPMLVGGPAAVIRPTRHISGSEAVGEGHVRAGATGQTITGLRPAGRAEIDGQTVDVVTVGGWVEAGRKIKVVEVHGNRIVVDDDK